MATWAEARAEARRLYELDADDRDEFALTLEWREGETLRAQRVLVRRFEAYKRDLVEVRSAFGEAADYDAEELLADNLDVPLGAVATHGRFVVLVWKAPLDALTVDGLLFVVRQIAVTADLLEGRRGRDRF